jgi:hypothetical protein
MVPGVTDVDLGIMDYDQRRVDYAEWRAGNLERKADNLERKANCIPENRRSLERFEREARYSALNGHYGYCRGTSFSPLDHSVR